MSVAVDRLPRPKPITKKALIERAREIIDRNQIDVPFSADDLIEFSEVTGTEVRFAVRRINPTYPDPRHVHVIAYDWSEPRQWSWVKAIRIDRDRDPAEASAMRRRTNEQRALRESVKDDLREFRECCEPQVCEQCGSVDDLCADHLHPPFIDIANEFLNHYGPIELAEFPGSSDRIADPNVEAAWVAFHAQRATYQLLCRPCNSSKGARRLG